MYTFKNTFQPRFFPELLSKPFNDNPTILNISRHWQGKDQNIEHAFSYHSSFSSDPAVPGHQRHSHGERVKCHKNAAEHLYQHCAQHLCQHCAQHFTNFHKAHKYLLAKFPMALSAKILPLNLQKKICTHQLAQKAQLRARASMKESQICSHKNFDKTVHLQEDSV